MSHEVSNGMRLLGELLGEDQGVPETPIGDNRTTLSPNLQLSRLTKLHRIYPKTVR